MISYIRHNSVFDLGSRTGTSTCVGLYKELDDIYSKYFNPQVHVQYNDTDCLCNMSGKQTLSGGSHAFVFHNGTISVTVDEQDNVTVADAGSGGGGGGLEITATLDQGTNALVFNKTYHEIADYLDLHNGILPVLMINDEFAGFADRCYYDEGYAVHVVIFDSGSWYGAKAYANSENDYPSYQP